MCCGNGGYWSVPAGEYQRVACCRSEQGVGLPDWASSVGLRLAGVRVLLTLHSQPHLCPCLRCSGILPVLKPIFEQADGEVLLALVKHLAVFYNLMPR